ncbi:HEXXH motif domain-containing protein [Thermomonospora umbrina]|uniref:HEXXH motif-containing protein n=1 Tax=Thermomonospora umbrina TaxID=111806 RepID=A0A3D9SHT2_9ACTN|nr:HEXXH motif domain-containing protein [Thermomonospora umbrina]REE95478.1 HEXXH motif-containing protein [Thermomonospora umbrina]
MSLGRHTVPEKTFLALAAGGGGADAIAHLRSAQRSKRLLLVRAVRDAALRSGHPEAPAARRAYELLARIEGPHPAEVWAVLGYPTVGAWARRTVLALTAEETDGPPARPGELAATAAAAAIRAAHPCTLEVPVRDGAVVLPSLGRALLPGHDTALVRSSPDGAEVTAGDTTIRLPADPHEDAPGWQALRRIGTAWQGSGVAFLLDDHDPDRVPGAELRDDRLTDEELGHWRATLDEAWRLLLSRHWTTAEEVAASITVLTPLVAPEHGQSSATPRHGFGNIGLSAPPDAHFLAVTLAHEVQHTKLSALLDVVPLTVPEDGSRYYAPWREDPRPAAGLLQGTYAHLGIAGFWRRQRDHETGETALRAHSDFARWREATDLGARTLAASGRLTAAGEGFVAEIRRTVRPWIGEPVGGAALDRARAAAAEHRDRWRLRNGEPATPPR